jgi:uncharacterized protein (PEP-CTERM system associated)
MFRHSYKLIRLRAPLRQFGRGVLCFGILQPAGLSAWADDFTVAPTIGFQETYTSNSGGNGATSTADLVTQVTPAVSLDETGPWSSITLNYSPTYNKYDFHTSPDRIDQNFNSTVSVTPSEEHLKIDFAAYASEEGATPNSNTISNNLLIATNNRVLFYAGSVIPHFSQRFGDVATIEAYYRLKSSNTSDQSVRAPGSASLSNDSLQQDPEIIIGSGDSFGRLSAQADFDHSNTTASGAGGASSNDRYTLGGQYHLTYDYSLTGSVGYQRIHYAATTGSSAYTNEGLTWNAGIAITPDPTKSLSVSYGLQEGIYVPTVKLSYSIGPRTSIVGSYIVTIQNELEAALQNLQYLAYDSVGNPIDSRTGLPFSLLNQSFGSQNVLFRDKPAQLSLVHQLERSAITLRLLYDARSAVSGPPSTETVSQVDIGYNRQLSDKTTASFDLGYTRNVFGGLSVTGGSQDTLLNASVSFFWTLSSTATISVTGTFFEPLSNAATAGTASNQVVLGFRKQL